MKIERISEDGLSREVWRFFVAAPRWGNDDQVNVILEYYGREARETKRHKFQAHAATRYSSSDTRAYNSGIKAADVPLPENVIAEAKARVTVVVHGADADRGRLI